MGETIAVQDYQPEYNLLNDAFLGYPMSILYGKLERLIRMVIPENWEFKDPPHQARYCITALTSLTAGSKPKTK